MIETVEDQFGKKKVKGSGPINITVLWSFYPNDPLSSKKTINDSVTFNLEIVNRCNLKCN